MKPDPSVAHHSLPESTRWDDSTAAPIFVWRVETAVANVLANDTLGAARGHAKPNVTLSQVLLSTSQGRDLKKPPRPDQSSVAAGTLVGTYSAGL